MSPAVDLFCATGQLHVDSKSRCRINNREPGGGGINVARNLQRMGADVRAVFPAGGYHGQLLVQMLEQDGLPLISIPANSETTQNLALSEEATGKQFHLVFPGAELAPSEWQACLETVRHLSPVPDYLVLSGSLPPGVPPEFSAQVARVAKAGGMKVILDTSGEALREASKEGVYLSKLNREDFTALGYAGGDDQQERLAAMHAMVRDGMAEVLVLTLGENGALLASSDGKSCHVAPKPVKVVSHVGAGDSFVSMITWRLSQGSALKEAFCYGVAAAAAAISTPGNQLRELELVEQIFRDGLIITDY